MTGWERLKATITGAKTNDNGVVAPLDEEERAKMLLRKISSLHFAKLQILGISYQVLGDAAWLILCDIYRHKLNGEYLSIDELQKSQCFAPSNAARYVKVLQQEGLVRKYPVDTNGGANNLMLTERGESKVRQILNNHY